MEWFGTIPPWAVFPVVTLAGIIVVVAVATVLRRRVSGTFPYNRRPAVLEPEERALHQALEQAVGERGLLLPKLRGSDVLSVRRNVSRRQAAGALDRIGSQAFDFVVCDPRDTRPLVAVELERGQESTQRRRRERFLDAACDAAGLAMVRVPASEQFAAAELREQLRPYLERSESLSVGEVTPDGRREPILDLPAE